MDPCYTAGGFYLRSREEPKNPCIVYKDYFETNSRHEAASNCSTYGGELYTVDDITDAIAYTTLVRSGYAWTKGNDIDQENVVIANGMLSLIMIMIIEYDVRETSSKEYRIDKKQEAFPLTHF